MNFAGTCDYFRWISPAGPSSAVPEVLFDRVSSDRELYPIVDK